ncbi:MAG: hypothetical protein AB1782_04765 [Cyanobacteriota bacterium]
MNKLHLLYIFVVVTMFLTGSVILAQEIMPDETFVNDGKIADDINIDSLDNTLNQNYQNALPSDDTSTNDFANDNQINYEDDDWVDKVDKRDNWVNLQDKHDYDQYSHDDYGGEGQDDGPDETYGYEQNDDE